MNTKERSILLGVGRLFLHHLSIIPVTLLFYGILAPMTVVVIFSPIPMKASKPWASPSSLLSIFGLLLFSSGLVLELCAVGLLHNVFFGRSASLWERAFAYHSCVPPVNITISWFKMIPQLFNDAFIIWRAWVVFQKRRWALYLSVLLCACTCALTIGFLSMMSTPSRYVAEFDIPSIELLALNVTVLSLSLATNITATSFIGWVLWSHLRFLKINLGTTHRQMFKLRNILTLLVDSGLAYMLLQSVTILLRLTARPLGSTPVAYNAMYSIYSCISYVYPAITIFLVRGPASMTAVQDTIMSLHQTETPEHA